MAPAFIKKLKNFCCCIPKTEDETENLIGNENENDWITATRVINQNRTSTNGISTFATGSSGLRGQSENLNQLTKSQNEAEEDAVNKILDRTQQCIIDVSNLDNSPMDIDVLQRSRLYSEAIKRHDFEVEKKNLEGLIIKIFNNNLGVPNGEVKQLIDFGTTTNLPETEVLNNDEFLWLSRDVDLFSNAFRLDPQIECKEELIAYMSLDD